MSRKNERYDVFLEACKQRTVTRLKRLCTEDCPIFGSTYIFETTFSLMNRLKSNIQNEMGDETLDACLPLSTTEIKAEIDAIIKSKKQYNVLNCYFVDVFSIA